MKMLDLGRARQLVAVLMLVPPYLLSDELTFADAQCARFEFPEASFDSDTMIVPKGENLQIHFVLNTEGCDDAAKYPRDVTITISKRTNVPSQNINKDVCKFSHNKESCTVFRHECQCPDKNGRYTVNKAWETDDETEWLWKTSTSYAPEKRLLMQQRYAPNITSLTLHPSDNHQLTPQIFEVASSVDILCAYEDGKPAVEPELWKADKKLPWDKDGNDKRKRRHRIESVICEDSDIYWCKAAASNRSVGLLVRCAPLYIRHSIQKDESVWQFLLKSYDASIAACTIAKHGAASDESAQDCSSKFKVEGTAPLVVLSLNVEFLGTAAKEGGNWTLTLANGIGSVTFSISVPSIYESTGNSTIEEDLHKFIEQGGKSEGADQESGPNRSAAVAVVDISVVSLAVVVLAIFNGHSSV